MPALTHGRVRNGFNQYARSVTYAQSQCKGPNGELLPCCKKKIQQQRHHYDTEINIHMWKS